MRIVLIFTALVMASGMAQPAHAKENQVFLENFSSWMDIAYTGDYFSCKMVIDNLYTLATNKKIWGNDNQTMDVITYMGQLGSDIAVNPTSGSQDYAAIRVKCVQTLGVIGGDYARLCVIRIGEAEKSVSNAQVVLACLNALKKMGNDKSYQALKSVMHIYKYIPKKDRPEGEESLIAYISCLGKLTKNTPLIELSNNGVYETLQELGNERGDFRVYSPEVRKRAKAALADLKLTPSEMEMKKQ